MDKWIGKVAVVTGASAGIGSAIAKSLASKGIIVVGLARRVERVEELAKNSDGKIYALKCDISDLKSIKESFKWIEEKFGVVSILINNAGKSTKFHITDEGDEATEKLTDVINTNFTGLVHCAREAIKLMKKSKDNYGMIINVSSVVDSVIPFGMLGGVYPSTKYAVKAFSEVLRQELITSGVEKIRVANLSPGVVRTEIMKAALEVDEYPEEYLKWPFIKPEDIADSVVYLLSTPSNVNITQLTIKPVGEKF